MSPRDDGKRASCVAGEKMGSAGVHHQPVCAFDRRRFPNPSDVMIQHDARDLMADVFISHASEDKDAVARPLSDALKAQNWDVWLDKDILDIGHRLPQ